MNQATTILTCSDRCGAISKRQAKGQAVNTSTGNPIADAALAYFGETHSYREAGFITPDGWWVGDAVAGSFRRVVFVYSPAGLKNARSVDIPRGSMTA